MWAPWLEERILHGPIRRDQSAAVGEGPSDHVAGFMIAVGTTVKPAMPKGGQLALSEVVVQHRFA